MSVSIQCPTCGLQYRESNLLQGCPRCMMGAAVASRSRSDVHFQPPTPAELAESFPRLEILELIGFGGMGIVYKVRQIELDRIAALKILPPELTQDPTFTERFFREAKSLARLTHPNIVGVFDLGVAGDLCYFLMEFIEGVNLRSAIQTHSIRPAEVLEIIPQICDALQFAHSQGIVHRDIKPENILLTLDGKVKVADFGLAKLLNEPEGATVLTRTRQALGTPRYMAPEQIEGFSEADHRSDIYSLGVVLYELLTGELPIGHFPMPSQKTGVDRRLDQVVLRTLEKAPAARYQQASEVKTAIQGIGQPGSRRGNWNSQPRNIQAWNGSSSRAGMATCTVPFFEYKSAATIFGLPVYHHCRGIDPKTGRGAVAKGWIAIGPSAVGALAIGGSSFGGVAIGGASVGLLSLGGASVGLLEAIGGASIGLIALGGGSIGGIGFGPAGLGILSLNAEGPHFLNNPIAQELWPTLQNYGVILILCSIFLWIGSILAIIASGLFAISRHNRVTQRRLREETYEPYVRHDQGWSGLFGTIAVIGLFAFLFLIVGVKYARDRQLMELEQQAVAKEREAYAVIANATKQRLANTLPVPTPIPGMFWKGDALVFDPDKSWGLFDGQATRIQKDLSSQIESFQATITRETKATIIDRDAEPVQKWSLKLRAEIEASKVHQIIALEWTSIEEIEKSKRDLLEAIDLGLSPDQQKKKQRWLAENSTIDLGHQRWYLLEIDGNWRLIIDGYPTLYEHPIDNLPWPWTAHADLRPYFLNQRSN